MEGWCGLFLAILDPENRRNKWNTRCFQSSALKLLFPRLETVSFDWLLRKSDCENVLSVFKMPFFYIVRSENILFSGEKPQAPKDEAPGFSDYHESREQ